MTGSKWVNHWACGTVYECSEIASTPQGSPQQPTMWLWSRKENLQRVWNRDRRAVWDQVGLSHCWHNGLVMVSDKARLRRGHNDQSRGGHQCSETTLTGESPFHISTPWGLNPGPSWRQANRCTTGPVELCMNAVRLQALHNVDNRKKIEFKIDFEITCTLGRNSY